MKNFVKKILFIPFIAKKITRLLAIIHQFSYRYLGVFASASEGGLHPKHRLICYHKFFVENVSKGDRVLDIGCGNGALLKDIAVKTDAFAVGVEISEENVKAARKTLSDSSKVEIVCSDIWEYNSNNQFETVILSNVLEHLDGRSALLRHFKMQYKPKKFLIRVPMLERDWLVLYKKELGIEWRLDPTHKTEYTEDELRNELALADLGVQKLIFRWGEIWVVAVPQRKRQL